MARELEYTKVLSEESSFQLVRTNPKLTGNLKLTVNEEDMIWLNSIPANLELSRDDFSKFPVDTTHSLSSNIYQFFKQGETPNEIIFQLDEKVDTTKTSKNYSDQFDFSNYFSGIKYLVSNKYDERLAYFAPLYIKDEIPNYFIILKIKDPLNKKIDEIKADYEALGANYKAEYLAEFFQKATIVKTFDLRPETKIGKLIRDYRFSPNFPIAPLTVNFREDQATNWNGILVNSGVLGSRGELLYSFYKSSSPLKFFEENITKGFERNGVIFPNILNLEFIFNDDESELYDFDRYLGFYVNSIDVSDFKLDLERAYSERANWENTPRLRRKYYDYEEESIQQSNPNGVILPYMDLGINLSEFYGAFAEFDKFYFNYIQDRDDKFYLPKISATQDAPVGAYDINFSSNRVDLQYTGTEVIVTTQSAHGLSTEDYVFVDSPNTDFVGSFFITKISNTQFSYIPEPALFLQASATGSITYEIGKGKIRLSNTQADLGKFFGPDNNIFLQDTGSASIGPGYSSIGIKIKAPLSHIDEFKFYHHNGTRQDSGGKYDIYTGVQNYPLVQAFGSYYAFNDFDEVIGEDTFYFNCKGLVNEVAAALAGALNSTRNRTFTAYAFEEWVFIKCNVQGNFDQTHKIKFTSPSSNYTTVNLGDTEEDNLINTFITFTGGSKFSGNRLVINYGHFNKIKDNLEELLIKTENGWSGVSKISRYFDNITELNSTSIADRTRAVSDYEQNMVITLDQEKIPSVRYGNFLIKKKSKPKFGLFSFFPIKDLDFDFLASIYLNFPKIDLYQHYYIPAGLELLESGFEYRVVGGSIEVDGLQYNNGDYFTILSNTAKYSIVSGDPIVTYSVDTANLPYSLNYPILDENRELRDFPGFSILKDPKLVIPQQNTDLFTLRDKFINGLTTTEYDFYKENIATDFALRSKIIPYINKWAIKNGKDSRDNPYRLNTEIVFGRNNFSPDHTDRSQNPDAFTHEWFYIESNFNYLNDIATLKDNNYYFDKPLDLDLLLTDKDYFINYFTYAPSLTVSGEEFAPVQFRYSKLFKNRAGQYESFFGFKIQFKDVIDSLVLGEDGRPRFNNQSNRFDDYNFSCILKPIKEEFYDSSKPPIKYEVIEHKDFKFILIVIKLYIGDESAIQNYWKEKTSSSTREAITNDPLSTTEFFFADSTYNLEFGALRPYQTILGDYRIKFNAEEVSNLTYNLIYSLKNKKFNTKLNNFSNVKLSKKIDLAQPITSNTLEELINPLTQNYPSLFSNEVLNPNGEKLIGIRNNQLNVDYLIDTFVGITPQNFNPVVKANSNTLLYEDFIRLASYISVAPFTTSFSSLPLSNSFRSVIEDKFQFFVIGGGEKYFERLFENISFAKFKQYVNSYNPVIEYLSYSYDSETGQAVLVDDPKFYLDILDQDEILKVNQVVPILDQDVPSQFSSIPGLSYVYEVSNLTPHLQLNRYNGEYEPIAVDMLTCFSKFKFKRNKIEDLTLANINLNIGIEHLMTIKNFNHIKVSNTKILSLESDDSYLPKYPSIGEIAIGTSPYFLLSSNWDWGFHYIWPTKTNLEPVSGTLRVEEDQSFIAKILSVPAEIELEDFNIKTLNPNASLDSINIDQIEFVVKENNTLVSGIINLNNVLTRYFIENGIEEKFNEFLVNSPEYIGTFASIRDYVKAYIAQNILELYAVNQVEFYKKSDSTLTSSSQVSNVNSINFQFLSDTERFDQGYSQIKSVEINNLDRLILRFVIRKDVSSGFNISPKIKIKFI